MGFRTHDEDGALDTMSLDDFLIENKEATFMLSVATDSMRTEGILRGDLLVVDRSKQPKDGDIVIAVEHGAFTVRRLEAGRETKVEAVVTAIIRKYS